MKTFGDEFVQVPNEMIDDGELSGAALLAFMAIRRYAWKSDGSGNGCYVSQQKIATLARLSVRRAQQAIDELIEYGVLQRRQRPGETCVYHVTYAAVTDRSMLVEEEPPQQVPDPSAPAAEGGAQSVPTKKTKQKKITKNEDPSGPVDALALDDGPSPVQQVFDYWQRTVDGKTRMSLTPGRRSKIQARLKHATVDELKLAIDNVAADPFLNGQNPQGTRYTDFKTIFQSREYVEGKIEAERERREGRAPQAVTDRRSPNAGVRGNLESAMRDLHGGGDETW